MHHCWWHGHVVLLRLLVVDEVTVVAVLDVDVEQAVDAVGQALLDVAEVVDA